jgi:hypothetical protein
MKMIIRRSETRKDQDRLRQKVILLSKDTVIAEAINLAEISAHPAEALAALVEVVRLQGEEIAHLRENQEIQATQIFRMRAQAPKRSVGKKQDARLNKLEALLIARGNEALTFSEVGKFLELGSRGKTNTRRQNMTAFGKILAEKVERFHVFNSSTQKGARMVCLAEGYYGGSKKV